MNRWLLLAGLIFAALCGYWGLFLYDAPDPAKMYVFSGVRGPSARSIVMRPRAAEIGTYQDTDPHSLAILVTNPASGWLGLVRGFKARGIPFTATLDPAVALQHRVVLVYPILSGRILSAEAFRALAEHFNQR